MNMKHPFNRLLAGAAMMLLSLQVYADGETLHIWLSNGTKTSIQLNTCPHVTFEGN